MKFRWKWIEDGDTAHLKVSKISGYAGEVALLSRGGNQAAFDRY
jgi:hypothetical protein